MGSCLLGKTGFHPRDSSIEMDLDYSLNSPFLILCSAGHTKNQAKK